jgi:hypothetical protein
MTMNRKTSLSPVLKQATPVVVDRFEAAVGVVASVPVKA